MKFSRCIMPGLALAALLAGCVDVDKETAAGPRVYWNPDARSVPAQPLALSAPQMGVMGVKPEGGGELTLPQLVDIALSNNPQTRSAWYGAKAAAANLGQVNSQYYPQITLSGNVNRSKMRSVTFNGATGAGTTYSTFYGPSVEISYVLWNFGANYAQTESARQTLYAANYQYNQQLQDVILSTQLAYFNYNAALGFVDAAQATLNDANTSYQAANQRLQSGLGTRQDERQAFAQVKNAEFELEQAQAQVETARAQLAQSLGIAVSPELKITRNETAPNLEQMDSDVSSLMAAAMRQRPNLMAAYATLESARYNLEAAKANRWPVISAVAAANYGYYSAGVTSGNPYNNYMAGIQISWDIFTGFNRTYAIISAREQQMAARADLHTQELQVMTDVWNFFYSYKSALRQVESTTAQVEAQQEAYNAINAGYNSGLNNYVDVVTALNNLATARQQKVQAEANLGTNLANLAHATGNLPLEPYSGSK